MSTIKTTNITHGSNSGTANIALASDGTITFAKPLDNLPTFGVRPSSDQTGVAQNTLTKIVWGTEDWDVGSCFASDKFTVPAGKAGIYHFDVQACIDDVDDTKEVELRLYKNGSGINTPQSDREWSSGNSSLIFVRHSLCYNLAVGDYIEVYIVHGTSGDQVVNADRTYWSGFRLAGYNP